MDLVNAVLSSNASQLSPIKLKIYNEWYRRSSRYRDPFIYLYLACDHKRQVCKVGISVRKPQVRLWDIGFECIHEWYLPNEYARSVEAFITAKYSDKWVREGNQAYNGRRECYPFGLVTELFQLIIKLLSGYKDLPIAQINGRSVKVVPELTESLSNLNKGGTGIMMKVYSYVSVDESPKLRDILMSMVPQMPKINSRPIGKGSIISKGGSSSNKFGGAKPSSPKQSMASPMNRGSIITKPTSKIGVTSSKRDQGTPKPGGTPTPPPQKPRSVSLGKNPVNSGMNINSGVK